MVSDRIVMDQKRATSKCRRWEHAAKHSCPVLALLPGSTAWGQNRDFHKAKYSCPKSGQEYFTPKSPAWTHRWAVGVSSPTLMSVCCDKYRKEVPVHSKWRSPGALVSRQPSDKQGCLTDPLLSRAVLPSLNTPWWADTKLKSSGSSHGSSWTSPLGYSCSQSRRAKYTGEKLIAVDREGQREWLCTFLGHWSASTGYTKSSHGSATPAASKLMKRGIRGPNCVFQGKLEAGNKKV